RQITWQGYYTSDIYFSKVEKGQWTSAQNMGESVNSIEDEECVFVTPDGKKMVIFEENEKNITGDLFMVSLETDSTKPIGFPEPVNSQSREAQGCITEDGNIVIISSDRIGGQGGLDLYML